MAQKTPQNFANHAKLVPGFHFIATGLLFFFAFWVIRQFIGQMGWETGATAALAISVILIGFYARGFANQNQDRIIRLEERLRMQDVLPEDLRSRIPEFTTSQLVGLRFAPDEELPALARRVLDEGIDDRKAIKKAIVNWRADHHRI